MRGVLAAGVMCACVFGVVVAGVSAQDQGRGQGRGRGQAPPPENLQVLPKDIERPALTAMMRSFTVALGVQCSHCHVGTPAERAKDDLPTKAKARTMIKMMMAINKDFVGVGEGEPDKVTCFTCHRGALKPLTAPPAGGGIH